MDGPRSRRIHRVALAPVEGEIIGLERLAQGFGRRAFGLEGTLQAAAFDLDTRSKVPRMGCPGPGSNIPRAAWIIPT